MKYSKDPFEEYKYKARFEFKIVDNIHLHSIDLYTDETNKEVVDRYIRDKVFNNYKIKLYNVKLIHWVSKEQDDLTNKFIESLEL